MFSWSDFMTSLPCRSWEMTYLIHVLLDVAQIDPFSILHCPHSVLQHLLSSLGSHLLPIIYHFPRTWLMFYLVISYILIAFWCFLFNLSKPTFCSQCYLILPRDIFFSSQNVMTLLLLICYLEVTVVHSL